MFVHRSNRLESLLDELAALVAMPGPAPTEPEVIVVQSKGMERWLALELAQHLGIWANARFPFPRRFIEEALAAVLDAPASEAPRFTPEQIVWSIAALLPDLVTQPAFAELRGYLEGDALGVRRLDLAARVADLFDQYPVYRPDRVLAWEAGEDDGWQSSLWRALVARVGATHIARRAADFAAAAARLGEAPSGLPCRISIFGIGSLPPLFVDLFAALGRLIEVHLFLLSPSREHWAEIRSRREIARELRAAHRNGPAAEPEEALALAEGNPLLASLGRMGRDFQFVLESRVDYVEDPRDLYVDPLAAGPRSMLAVLQSDILSLRHRRAGDPATPPLPVARDDRSITIHVCHGPMREVEVLRDQILAMLHDVPGLEPHDILVMSPDLKTYAPLVEAIFGTDPRERDHVPFRIADRGIEAESPVLEAFFALLSVVAGRVSASAVLELLGREPIRTAFAIAEDELDALRGWVVESNVRWGIDAAHRARSKQPAFHETTWRFGLDRLLLGYAMPGEGRVLFQGTLPFDDVEGSDGDLLGRFAAGCERLFALEQALAGPHPVAVLHEKLSAALDGLLAAPDGHAHELQALREALADLVEDAREAGFDEPVPLEVVRARLEARLGEPGGAHAFLARGVTFCALLPMRSIPFRVVCLLGMNDEIFPRAARAASLDLIAEHPRRGDRSPRDEDRYLFLEALLSARDRLLLTYVGQSMRDHAEIPPSVVVSELLDAIDEGFTLDPPARGARIRPAREHVLVRHPLQPFSPVYFRAGGDARLFSYAARFCEGARALIDPRVEEPPFFHARLRPPDEPITAVTLDQLSEFFRNPMRALLRDRIGLRLEEGDEDVPDREPMDLSPLDKYQLGSDLLRRALGGDDPRAAYQYLRASGALPLGAVGRCRFEQRLPEIERMTAEIRRHADGEPLAPREIDLLAGGARVTGWLRELWPGAQVRYRFGKVKASNELALWIRHLALQLAAKPGDPSESLFVGYDGKVEVVRYRPVADALGHLAALVDLYRAGQEQPLPFFPETSLAYAKALVKGQSEDAARAAARSTFKPDGGRGAEGKESADPYIARVLGGRDPTDPTLRLASAPGAGASPEHGFAELAATVFRPLIEHREEG
ncbi:exodeoxyribonuclease V subunit gamma [Sorangium sp. So ce1036]|uniref:exodeoxyribonuclease V subunit gamma n=1 Tax=Sorangium sp. So ce1036 TaxID=3133328 RepID=UPI003EFC33D5